MKIPVAFCDLSHVGHACNTIPYGVSLVALYATKNHPNLIQPDFFKNPIDFKEYLQKKVPKIVCFSNYIWGVNLSLAFSRQIKKLSPETIIIFGGPNYPLDPDEQEKFFQDNPMVDFHIAKEGEQAFSSLLDALTQHDFSANKLKESGAVLPSCHYYHDGKMVRGELSPRLKELDAIPSPYLAGYLDKFLHQHMVPLLQTTRGCPFQCTFCQEGNVYFNKLSRFSVERIRDEIKYIAQRARVPNLMTTDSNFGMYPEDLAICREISIIQKKHGWPKTLSGFQGKNMKERVLEGVRIIEGSHYLSAAIQSTSEQVLKNVKRNNMKLDNLIGFAKEGETLGSHSFSEIILGLPGDTKQAHFDSMRSLIDTGIKVVRSHQFIMLPDSESSSKKDRKQFAMDTRFRLTPNTFNSYDILGETVSAPEIDEICVSNNTMSFKDYQDCRCFDLTIESFYNNGVFLELCKLLKLNDIRVSAFITGIHERCSEPSGPLYPIYQEFIRQTIDLWESREKLEASIKDPKVMEQYRSGELGKNEQTEFRAILVFNHTETMNDIAFGVARELLKDKGILNAEFERYLNELSEYSLTSKIEPFSLDKKVEKKFHYDFVELESAQFNENPFSHIVPEGIDLVFAHTEEQRDLITNFINTYGTSTYGLGSILSAASTNLRSLFRDATHATPKTLVHTR